MDKITIYAELSKSQYGKILSGEYGLCVPTGVRMTNKKGKRGLFFECENDVLADMIKNALKSDAINFQVN
jgi:hypothetical protein